MVKYIKNKIMAFTDIFKDENTVNEKNLVGFASFAIMAIFAVADIVTGILLSGVNNPQIYIPLLKRMQEPAFAYWRFVKKRTAYQIQEEEAENLMEEIVTEIEEL